MTPPLSSFADMHAHSSTGPRILTSVEPGQSLTGAYGEAWYSVGIHPWSTDTHVPESTWEALREALTDPRVIAVGECGLDRRRGGAPEVQEAVFMRQARMAEAARLPLIIHCVGRYGRLMELKKALTPSQRWIIHGFTGKAELARQLLAAGFDISLGPRSRQEIAALIPPGRCFTESDA